jgi:hypothetical protein
VVVVGAVQLHLVDPMALDLVVVQVVVQVEALL